MTATSDPTPVTEQGALVLRCRDEHASMDAVDYVFDQLEQQEALRGQ